MFDTFILSQQASDRWQLTGGIQVQNQPRRGFSCWYHDRKKLYKKINSPVITLIYHQCDVHCLQSVVLRWNHVNYVLMYPHYPNPPCLFLFQFVISCISQNDSKHPLVMDDYLFHSAVNYVLVVEKLNSESKQKEVFQVQVEPFLITQHGCMMHIGSSHGQLASSCLWWWISPCEYIKMAVGLKWLIA